jgi:hypothetical protein
MSFGVYVWPAMYLLIFDITRLCLAKRLSAKYQTCAVKIWGMKNSLQLHILTTVSIIDSLFTFSRLINLVYPHTVLVSIRWPSASPIGHVAALWGAIKATAHPPVAVTTLDAAGELLGHLWHGRPELWVSLRLHPPPPTSFQTGFFHVRISHFLRISVRVWTWTQRAMTSA